MCQSYKQRPSIQLTQYCRHDSTICNKNHVCLNIRNNAGWNTGDAKYVCEHENLLTNFNLIHLNSSVMWWKLYFSIYISGPKFWFRSFISERAFCCCLDYFVLFILFMKSLTFLAQIWNYPESGAQIKESLKDSQTSENTNVHLSICFQFWMKITFLVLSHSLV